MTCESQTKLLMHHARNGDEKFLCECTSQLLILGQIKNASNIDLLLLAILEFEACRKYSEEREEVYTKV